MFVQDAPRKFILGAKGSKVIEWLDEKGYPYKFLDSSDVDSDGVKFIVIESFPDVVKSIREKFKLETQ